MSKGDGVMDGYPHILPQSIITMGYEDGCEWPLEVRGELEQDGYVFTPTGNPFRGHYVIIGGVMTACEEEDIQLIESAEEVVREAVRRVA